MKLNLGCGNKRKEGYLGVDKYPCDAVDKIADLNEKLPFDDSVAVEIWLLIQQPNRQHVIMGYGQNRYSQTKH